jgi:hypothetical protein
MSNGYDLSNYVEVSDRIQEWFVKHPEGRILTEVQELTDKRVVVKATVSRDTAEVIAGVGHSALSIPGTTPYTRGSELENAETSAVGRALVMAGLVSKKVASADEVRAKRVETPQARPFQVAAVSVGSGPEEASPTPQDPSTDLGADDAIRFAAESMGFVAQDQAKGSGMCWKHARPWKFKSGETNGKAWEFWSCGSRDPEAKKGWCDERPTPAWISAQKKDAF